MKYIVTPNGKFIGRQKAWAKMDPPIDPYNPLGLPANTIRVKFKSGYTPTQGDSRTLVDAENNVWDIYKSGNDWSDLFMSCSNLLEVLGANTTGVTIMCRMLNSCSALTTVPVFDTSDVNDMLAMFYRDTSLTAVPLFNTSSITEGNSDMSYMFGNCVNVQSGALALYQQVSANPPYFYSYMFKNCGSNTVNGAAELAQIPDGWK